MIVRSNRAKITDFGIARMRSSQVKTQTGMVLGSPKYMSPEQVMGQRADGRSDIFSLGVVLYEMLTGSAPFRGDSITALMFQVLNTVPTPPRQIIPEVPEMLNFVMAKALAKKAEERYQSAQEFANDLRECAKYLGAAQAGAPIAPIPASAVAPDSADDGAKTEIVEMFRTMPRTRLGDALEMEREAPTLNVSKTFDSYEATLRVAAQTGMIGELEDYAKTQKLARPATPAAVPANSGPAAPHGAQQATAAAAAQSATVAGTLMRHEGWILGAGIIVALLVAAAIVFL
jgi:serine/threonine-protein kinase